jgi:hypothetical protein
MARRDQAAEEPINKLSFITKLIELSRQLKFIQTRVVLRLIGS